MQSISTSIRRREEERRREDKREKRSQVCKCVQPAKTNAITAYKEITQAATEKQKKRTGGTSHRE
jgi:hypothetical protein